MKAYACCIVLTGTLVIILSSSSAHGGAEPSFVPPPTCIDDYRNVIVGDTTSDPSCDANDIQSAINSAYTNNLCHMTIHVTREHLYTNQALVINDHRNVTLAGWGDGKTCADIRNNECTSAGCRLPLPSANPLVTLSGSVGNSVIHVDGDSNVSLLNLTITGGSVNSDEKGGGIYYDGVGTLTLQSTTVNLNHAGYGAGININGDGGAAALVLDDYSQILANTADVSGGGIRVEGDARLFALKEHTWIGFNNALNGYGGGVEVVGPARADIGSPGFNGIAVIYGNKAEYGGGMDVIGTSSDQSALARIFTTDPKNPVAISGNLASRTGGGVYLKPNFASAHATLCAFDFKIDGNAAQEGSAIYSDLDSGFVGIFPQSVGSDVLLNTAGGGGGCQAPETTASLGGVQCAAGTACNEFLDNIAEDDSNMPTAGSTVLLQTLSKMEGARFSARRNQGGHVLGIVGDDHTVALLHDCLIVDNVVSEEVIAEIQALEGDLTLDSCTIAGNMIDAASVVAFPTGVGGGYGVFSIRNTIIDQPNKLAVSPSLVGFTTFGQVLYVLTTDKTTFPASSNVVLGEPTFVDAASGDYHQLRGSIGVDFAPQDADAQEPSTDLDGNPRVFDIPSVGNIFGPMDLGPYELPTDDAATCYVSDTIFCNGFEIEN
jgi:hypothetical protein